MASELHGIVIDAGDHRRLGAWWAEVLGYDMAHEADDEVWIEPPGDGPGPALGFIPVPERKTVKNRLHFDLRAPDQVTEVERLLGMGATRADVGQGPDVSWVVLADPEGNEFCVLHGPSDRPVIAQVAIDALDPRALAAFYTAALGYVVVDEEEEDGVFGIAPPEDAPGMPLDLLRVPDAKTVKNRLHLDLSPGAEGQDAEVDRLLALGASRADIGQGEDVTWVVLADPEGNEFCVLRPR